MTIVIGTVIERQFVTARQVLTANESHPFPTPTLLVAGSRKLVAKF